MAEYDQGQRRRIRVVWNSIMAILTVAELQQLFDPDRIRQLASDSSTQFGKVVYNETVVQTIITQAIGIVINSLSLQYSAAQLEADAGVKRITADIVMYYLEARRPPVSAATLRLYSVALSRLTQLQKGEAKLAAVAQLLPTGPTEIPTEAISTGFFNLTEEEQASLT